MKKRSSGISTVFILKFLFLCIILTNKSLAQHKPELWGVSSYSNFKNNGYIFKYDVANKKMIKVAWMGEKFQSRDLVKSGFFAERDGLLYGVISENDSVCTSKIISYNPLTNVRKEVLRFNSKYYRGISGQAVSYNGKYYFLMHNGKDQFDKDLFGSILQWDPITNTITSKHNFKDKIDGWWPRGNLSVHNGLLYGTTTFGGKNDHGTLFSINPATSEFHKLVDFKEETIGRYPDSYLNFYNGRIYGISRAGGLYGKGILYEFDIADSVIRKLYDFEQEPSPGAMVQTGGKLFTLVENMDFIEFDVSNFAIKSYRPGIYNAEFPGSPLTLYDNRIYVSLKKRFQDGSFIASWKPGDDSTHTVGDFEFEDIGEQQTGAYFPFKGKLYARAEYGSKAGWGSIYSVDTENDDIDFLTYLNRGVDGTSLLNANSNLLYYNRKFYGTTQAGGYHNAGLLYELDPSTMAITRLHDFTENGINSPYGNLRVENNMLEGITSVISPSMESKLYNYDLQTEQLTPLQTVYQNSSYLNDHGIDVNYASVEGNVYFAKRTYINDPAGIYLYNESSNSYTLKFSFPVPIVPALSKGLRTLNNKLIGTGTIKINQVDEYLVYEYDPANNDFRYKVIESDKYLDFPMMTGSPILFNNKIYVLTQAGCNTSSSLLEWDQAADTAAFYCLQGFGAKTAFGTLTEANGKLYGLCTEGIVCFDPATKVFNFEYQSDSPMFNTSVGQILFDKKLSFRWSNSPPVMQDAEFGILCATDTAKYKFLIRIADPEADLFEVTASAAGEIFVADSGVHIIKDANEQYYVEFTTGLTEGLGYLEIVAVDSLSAQAKYYIPVKNFLKKPVSFTMNKDTICTRDSSFILSGGYPIGGVYTIDGQPSVSLDPASYATGIHSIMYTYQQGNCKDSVSHEIFITNCDSTGRMGSQTLLIYPNPTNGITWIENNKQLMTAISVYNLQGNLVQSVKSADNPIRMYLLNLEPGVYYIKSTNSDGTKHGKIQIIK